MSPDNNTMRVLDAPELRAVNERPLIRTAAGVVIGGAYVRPPAPQSADADRVQRALLGESRSNVWADRCICLIGIATLAWVLIDCYLTHWSAK